MKTLVTNFITNSSNVCTVIQFESAEDVRSFLDQHFWDLVDLVLEVDHDAFAYDCYIDEDKASVIIADLPDHLRECDKRLYRIKQAILERFPELDIVLRHS